VVVALLCPASCCCSHPHPPHLHTHCRHHQKCDTNNFCKRNRGAAAAYAVDGGSLKVAGGVLSAVVRNTAAQHAFNFSLKAYGPVLRLIVDELPSDTVPRYQVPCA
jgi:hypothetical protein